MRNSYPTCGSSDTTLEMSSAITTVCCGPYAGADRPGTTAHTPMRKSANPIATPRRTTDPSLSAFTESWPCGPAAGRPDRSVVFGKRLGGPAAGVSPPRPTAFGRTKAPPPAGARAARAGAGLGAAMRAGRAAGPEKPRSPSHEDECRHLAERQKHRGSVFAPEQVEPKSEDGRHHHGRPKEGAVPRRVPRTPYRPGQDDRGAGHLVERERVARSTREPRDRDAPRERGGVAEQLAVHEVTPAHQDDRQEQRRCHRVREAPQRDGVTPAPPPQKQQARRDRSVRRQSGVRRPYRREGVARELGGVRNDVSEPGSDEERGEERHRQPIRDEHARDAETLAEVSGDRNGEKQREAHHDAVPAEGERSELEENGMHEKETFFNVPFFTPFLDMLRGACYVSANFIATLIKSGRGTGPMTPGSLPRSPLVWC